MSGMSKLALIAGLGAVLFAGQAQAQLIGEAGGVTGCSGANDATFFSNEMGAKIPFIASTTTILHDLEIAITGAAAEDDISYTVLTTPALPNGGTFRKTLLVGHVTADFRGGAGSQIHSIAGVGNLNQQFICLEVKPRSGRTLTIAATAQVSAQ